MPSPRLASDSGFQPSRDDSQPQNRSAADRESWRWRTLTADTLYSRFTNTTDARSFGHWFTPSNLTHVVTDANGTAIDLTQGVGMASDFHDKAFDKKTNLTASGINAEWKLSDKMTLNLDGSFSRAIEDRPEYLEAIVEAVRQYS